MNDAMVPLLRGPRSFQAAAAVSNGLSRLIIQAAIDLGNLRHPSLALGVFQRIGDELEVAITQMCTLLPLIYASRYDEAYARGDQARTILERYAESSGFV